MFYISANAHKYELYLFVRRRLTVTLYFVRQTSTSVRTVTRVIKDVATSKGATNATAAKALSWRSMVARAMVRRRSEKLTL